MSMIATLLPQVQLQRLRGVLREREDLIVCDDWSALRSACDRQPVRVAVIDLFLHGGPNFPELRRLKQHRPRLAVLCYVAVSVENARALFDAGRIGLDGLIVLDRDDSPVELIRAVSVAETRSLADLLRRSLRGTDSVAYDAMMIAVSRAHERLAPQHLSRLLGVPRRTISERLARAGFPPPKRLLSWGRLIVAGYMLEDQHRSADRVAASLDFPSGSAFRNTCQRYLHATPGEIRSRGGAEYVIRSLLRQIRLEPTTGPLPAREVRRLALAV